jgi:hypothetical protein
MMMASKGMREAMVPVERIELPPSACKTFGPGHFLFQIIPHFQLRAGLILSSSSMPLTSPLDIWSFENQPWY